MCNEHTVRTLLRRSAYSIAIYMRHAYNTLNGQRAHSPIILAGGEDGHLAVAVRGRLLSTVPCCMRVAASRATRARVHATRSCAFSMPSKPRSPQEWTLPNIPFVRCPRVSPRLLLRAAPILRLWRLWLSGAPPGLTHESCASSRSSSSASRRSGLSARSLTTLRTLVDSRSTVLMVQTVQFDLHFYADGVMS